MVLVVRLVTWATLKSLNWTELCVCVQQIGASSRGDWWTRRNIRWWTAPFKRHIKTRSSSSKINGDRPRSQCCNKPVDCAPSSECPQFRMPPSFDRCTPPRRRFNQNIPQSVVLLQQCHCRYRHRGKLQNLSPPSVLFESSRFFCNTQEAQTQKMMDQNFEIRSLWFLIYFF